MQGSLLHMSARHTEAESVFPRRDPHARGQDAGALELRASTGLAGLSQGLGKPSEARRVLSGIYGHFTEGFETHDVTTAGALLRELSQAESNDLRDVYRRADSRPLPSAASCCIPFTVCYADHADRGVRLKPDANGSPAKAGRYGAIGVAEGSSSMQVLVVCSASQVGRTR